MYQHTIIIEELRTLIGCRVRHGGILCEVVEILEHGPFVVLLNLEHGTIIQTNQHGDASRRVPLTYTIPVMHHTEGDVHPTFAALELED
ncbi:MAG: hypothetical protein AMJ69_00055 [Gammaproteobacteria bacterium SG8_47]|nr:MAG: hypothetical protein AMJ69_00055 [Gammaproteobacteria bacterium SG8_47]